MLNPLSHCMVVVLNHCSTRGAAESQPTAPCHCFLFRCNCFLWVSYSLQLLTCPGAVELRNALTSRFGVELPATATFDYPSVAALSGFIAAHTDGGEAVHLQEPEADAPAGNMPPVDLQSVR